MYTIIKEGDGLVRVQTHNRINFLVDLLFLFGEKGPK